MRLLMSELKKTGWLGPDGEFFPCEYGDHDIKAEELSEAVEGFIFGYKVEPSYSATYSKTLERYGFLKVQEGVFFVPDYVGWDDEMFVKKEQYDWLSSNIDLSKTIPLRIKGSCLLK
jgi:hypothetical protein